MDALSLPQYDAGVSWIGKKGYNLTTDLADDHQIYARFERRRTGTSRFLSITFLAARILRIN